MHFSPSFDQHLHWYVVCVSSSRTSSSARSWWRFSASVLCSNHVMLSFTLCFCSELHTSVVTLLLLFDSALTSLLYFRSLVTCARLPITHSSSSFGLLAKKGFTALVTVLMKKSLIESVVFSVSRSGRTSLSFLQATSGWCLITFGLVHSFVQHSWPQTRWLFSRFFLL